jgi:hypothetical protein
MKLNRDDMADVAEALERLGNIINDAPYRLEERDGAWQGFLQNKQDILNVLNDATPNGRVDCGACIGTGFSGPDQECAVCRGSGFFTSEEMAERQRNVQRWYEQDQIIRELREELRITVAALKLELQSANVSAATRSDSVVADGVTLPVGEKPALTCNNGLPHYCPNCDRSFDDILAAENRRTKRSTREDGR